MKKLFLIAAILIASTAAAVPDGRYRLRYTASLSDRIHGMAIDDIGLQPDFYLDPSIPRWKWVDHVNEVLNYE